MPAEFSEASSVKVIADELMSCYHKHLLEHRVRVEYIFSDEEPEADGVPKFGKVTRVSGINAYLAREWADPPLNDLVFVCNWCLRWGAEDELKHVYLDKGGNGERKYPVCPSCFLAVEEMNLSNERVQGRLISKAEKADAKALEALPTNPTFFVMVLYKPYWDRASEKKRRASVDYLLCAMGAGIANSGDVKLSIVKPVEIYSDVIVRHGTDWSVKMEILKGAFRKYEQMSLGLQ